MTETDPSAPFVYGNTPSPVKSKRGSRILMGVLAVVALFGLIGTFAGDSADAPAVAAPAVAAPGAGVVAAPAAAACFDREAAMAQADVVIADLERVSAAASVRDVAGVTAAVNAASADSATLASYIEVDPEVHGLLMQVSTEFAASGDAVARGDIAGGVAHMEVANALIDQATTAMGNSTAPVC